MNRHDLDQLDGLLLSPARAVVSMREVHAGATEDDIVGMRHDVDDNRGALQTAVKMAAWEADRGYRSTYYLLHTASYWADSLAFRNALERVASHGHEIGIHANAIAEALRYGGDPTDILQCAIDQLRAYGHTVTGVVGHGDEICNRAQFVNDEMFVECARPGYGAPDRAVSFGRRTVQLSPRPLADFGLDYVSIWLPRGRYLSDSGGTWHVAPETVADGPGQLHILAHPDWWGEAFTYLDNESR